MSTVVEPKPGVDVGRVVVPITIENYSDLQRVQRGEIGPEHVRRVQLEALVDSGATFLCLPQDVVQQLGLDFLRMKPVRGATGVKSLSIYGVAKITVEDRECTTEVMSLPPGVQPLLGQIPLEMMDWWIDLANRRLVGNPEHGGQWMAEAF